MGKVYARTILRGIGMTDARTLSDVPKMWLAATIDALAHMCDEETYTALLDEAGIEQAQ